MTVLATMCPRVEAYLASLPAGLGSFPGHLVRASSIHELLEVTPDLRERAEAYPDPLRRLVLAPPRISDWVPEVLLNTLFLIQRADCCATDDDFFAVVEQVNRRLLSSGALLFRVASPRQLVGGARARWNAFHHGVDLRIDGVSDRGAQLAMCYPTCLMPEVVAHSYVSAFRVAFSLARAEDVCVELVSYDQCTAQYTARWR